MFPVVLKIICISEGTIGQMIYPADMLADMQGSTITGLKFYADGTIKFGGCTLQLSFKIVDQSGFTEAVAFTALWC